MKKRIISMILSFIIVIGILPMTANAAGLTIEQLMEKYPDGSKWTSSFDGSYECAGFARLLCYEAYGSDYWINNNGGWKKYTDSSYIDNGLKAGDYVRYKEGTVMSDGQIHPGHSVFVVGVYDDEVAIADCNSDWDDTVRWGTIERSVLKKYFNRAYSAPYELPASSAPSNYDLRIEAWVSEKGRGYNAEQAVKASQFQVGKEYYCWYKMYDAVSGKYLNELFPSLNYDVQMTWSGPNGKIGSCNYSNSDVDWFRVTATEPGDYTCEITTNGDIKCGYKVGFSINSNMDIQVRYWISEKGRGYNAEQAAEATQFLTGKMYYCWYEIFDAVSGKRLNDILPSLNYDIQMEWSGPKGFIESCSYPSSDVNWFGVNVDNAGTYTCKITASGGINGDSQTSFTVAAGIEKPTVYMDKSSVSLTTGETTTCTVGVIPNDAATVNYGAENSNVCEVSVGEVTSIQNQIYIPLKITGLAPGKTNVKLHFLNSAGNTLTTSTISVTVVAGVGASTGAVFNPVTDIIWGYGEAQSDNSGEADYVTVEASAMGAVGTDVSSQNASEGEASVSVMNNNTIPSIQGTADTSETAGIASLTAGVSIESSMPTTDSATYISAASLTMSKVPVQSTPNEPDTVTKMQFADVKKDDYFYNSVNWAVTNGITTGTTTSTFSPTTECTNAHFITFLWRAAGCPEPKTANCFTDVRQTDYYYKAAVWALENGLISAYSDGGFHPDQPISRSNLVVVLWRYAGSPDTESATPFTDVKSNMPYAKAVNWAVANDITTGTSNATFSPNTICNRAQIVTFLYRYFG